MSFLLIILQYYSTTFSFVNSEILFCLRMFIGKYAIGVANLLPTRYPVDIRTTEGGVRRQQGNVARVIAIEQPPYFFVVGIIPHFDNIKTGNERIEVRGRV